MAWIDPSAGVAESSRAGAPALRVLLLTTSYPLRADSASGVFVKRLAESLSAKADVRVLTPCDTQPLGARPDGNPGVRCFRYAPRRWQLLAHAPGGIPAALSRSPLLRALAPALVLAMIVGCWRRAEGRDLILANWSVCGLAGGIAGRLRGIPVITVIRGEDVNRAETSAAYRVLLRVCVAMSSRVVAVSESMGRRLAEQFPKLAGRVAHIPNGVEEAFLNVAPGPSDGKGLRLVAIGSLIPVKGIDIILRALADPECSARLTCVGGGAERGRLERLAEEHGLGARVEFAGALPPERVAAVLEAHDALVLASHREGRPNVVTEAMAAGRAVVASDLPGVRELVEDGVTGLLFPAGDHRALARCLIRLEDPELRARLGRQARAEVVARGLTWPETARRYARLFEETVRPRSACAG